MTHTLLTQGRKPRGTAPRIAARVCVWNRFDLGFWATHAIGRRGTVGIPIVTEHLSIRVWVLDGLIGEAVRADAAAKVPRQGGPRTAPHSARRRAAHRATCAVIDRPA